jgi:hypothetical protein
VVLQPEHHAALLGAGQQLLDRPDDPAERLLVGVPSSVGSIPFFAMKSSNDLTVPQRPVLIRMVGMPRR